MAPLIADFDAMRADATRRMKKIGMITAILALPMIGAGWYLSVDWLLGLGVMIALDIGLFVLCYSMLKRGYKIKA